MLTNIKFDMKYLAQYHIWYYLCSVINEQQLTLAATGQQYGTTKMAKYTATYKCGHEEQVTLFGPYSERERKLERMANTLCPHCQREQNEQRTGITLEGSDKQANWAYDIMARINALFDQLAAQIKHEYIAALEEVRADYNAHRVAKWWIDEADSTDTRAIALEIQEKLTK